MKRVIIPVVIVVVALAAFVGATKLLKKSPPPSPIIPSASPTPAAITDVEGLYQAETQLNNLNVDSAGQAYNQSIQNVR
jgi:hypothetical protein